MISFSSFAKPVFPVATRPGERRWKTWLLRTLRRQTIWVRLGMSQHLAIASSGLMGSAGLTTAQSELVHCEHRATDRSRHLHRVSKDLRMVRDQNRLMFLVEQVPQRKNPRLKFWKSDRVVRFIENNRLGRVLSSNRALPAREKPKVISALSGKAMNQRS